MKHKPHLIPKFFLQLYLLSLFAASVAVSHAVGTAEPETTANSKTNGLPAKPETRAQSTKLSLLPAPWKDGEEMRLELKFPTGYFIGVAFCRVQAGKVNDTNVWRFSSRTFAGVHSFSRVVA